MNKQLTILTLWARELHKSGICYHNHELSYGNGWFYFDEDKPFHNTELVTEAAQLNKEGVTGSRRYEGMREIFFFVDKFGSIV